MRRFFLIMLLSLCCLSLTAQFYNGYQQDFGKNRVQYDEKFWFYFRHERFDVYFDKNGRNLAEFVTQNVDTNYAELKKKLEFEYSRRIVFVVYNTLSDFRQSNIGYSTSEAEYNVGGTAQIIDNKVMLYFSGDHDDLIRQVRKGIAEVMMSEYLFGVGSHRRILSNTTNTYPDWFFDGMTEYYSCAWSMEKEVAVCQKLQKYKKATQLYGNDAVLFGHALWNYVAERYGDVVVSNILYMCKLTGGVDDGFQYVMGKSLQTVWEEMIAFYSLKDVKKNDGAEANVKIPKRLAKRVVTEVALNPSASKFAMVTNKSGKATVWLYDFSEGKPRKIKRIGESVEQITDYSYPVVQWNPNLDVLAYFYEKKGKLWFAIYNCKNQDGIVQEFHHFEKVLDFSYSQDGNRIVFTGVRGGQTDVYEYHIPTFEYTQLTNDAWDERSPIYLQGDKKIVFASNKNGGAQNKNYDLFVYDGKTVERLHPTVADEGKSVELADGSFLYLMSDNTASKLYSVKMDSTVSYVDTAFHYSYFNNDYVLKNPIENVSTFSLADNQLLQVFQSENCNKLHLSKIDEHSFEPIDFEQNEQILTDCENFVQPERETANLYNRNFYINQLVNQLDFNFVNTGYQAFTGGEYNYGQRVNMLLKLGVIDLFEDYRLTGAYRFSGILGANEYLLSLENLKHRIDRQYVFHRQTSLVYRTNSSTVYYDRVQDNNFICRYKYPISQLHSISVNPSFRYVRNVALAMNDKTLVEPTVDEFWLGLSCNYVFDNVRKIDVNIYNGTRTKVFAECFGQLNKKDSYLAVFGFDARHYQKLHRNLILASRIAFSSSYGTSPLLFYLGAVDNWINLFGRYTVYDSSIEYDHSVNWAYQAVGTNMRGFAQNIRNGNTFAVANVELRWPMIQYFFAKPLKSDILRYFQVVGFADFGGAWSGLIPGLKDNAYNFTIIDTAPIHVEIDEQRQPFVAGYGYGFRTRLFGYMIRLDIGWGYDEGVVQKLSQFSLGMDF